MDTPFPRVTLREQLLAVIRQIPAFAECDPDALVEITIRCEDAKLKLAIDPTRTGTDSDREGTASHTDLTQMEQDLLAVATATPQAAKTLARRAGKTMGSHVSTALTSLCRLRLLVRTPDGYCLPE